MCNPTHKKSFTLNVYTSNPNITKEEFFKKVMEKVVDMEYELNKDMSLRWYVQEGTEE